MSSSKLQIEVGDLLDKTFPEYHIRENFRPDWLMSSNCTRLELDFYIEELKIAFEVQGAQHYEFVALFHGDEDGFEKQKQRDEEKKNLCYGAGIKLIEIFSSMDAIIEIKTLKEREINISEIQSVLDENNVPKHKRQLEKENTVSFKDYKKLEGLLHHAEDELLHYKNLVENLERKLAQERAVAVRKSLVEPNDLIKYELSKWSRKAIKRIGQEINFECEEIPFELSLFISSSLGKCKTKQEIEMVFLEAINTLT